MAVVRQRVRLAASPAAVWRLVTDFVRMPRWFLGVRRVKCQAAMPGPGVERELTTLLGHSYVERFTGCEFRRSFSWSVVTLPWFAARWDARLQLVPLGSGTEISWRIEIDPKGGVVGEALARMLLVPVVWLVLTLSLRRLRSLCTSTDPAPRRLSYGEAPRGRPAGGARGRDRFMKQRAAKGSSTGRNPFAWVLRPGRSRGQSTVDAPAAQSRAARRRPSVRNAARRIEEELITARRIGPMIATGILLMLDGGPAPARPRSGTPATRIKHVVVIFQENHSFDAYFGTYPVAANPPGQPAFRARPHTPSVNGLTETLLGYNPNSSNPFRIDRGQAYTCDQDHDYTAEQRARNGGLMNEFPRYDALGPTNPRQFCRQNDLGDWDTVMGYFDGNTVTALWAYAQRFAMSDNSFATMSGQSTRGALNLTAGDTFGVLCGPAAVIYGDVPECGPPVASTATPAPSNGTLGTLVDDTDPHWDVCSAGATAALTGPNVGDLLDTADVTWGWFQGGFTLSSDGSCSSSHPLEAYDRAVGVDPATDLLRFADYVPHHNPFQYFAATANPRHLPPTSVAMVGKTDQANHLYDLTWFWDAARAGSLPAVSFLKAPAYQNGHPGNSDPLDEQTFLVTTLNRLQRLPEWKHMAVIIAWDDSDGWYDHVMPPIVNRSSTPLDFLCGSESDGPGARCGYGPRLPLLIVSPYAKRNYVSHELSDQTSVLSFIEDIWLDGARISEISFDRKAGSLLDMFDLTRRVTRRLRLDAATGLPRRTR